MRRLLPIVVLMTFVTIAACADSTPHDAQLVPRDESSSDAWVTLPAPESQVDDSSVDDSRPGVSAVALFDDRFQLAIIDPTTGTVVADRQGWQSRASLDGSYAVSTVIVSDGHTKVAWDSIPDGRVIGGTVIEEQVLEVSATELNGQLAALVNPAEPIDDAIAGTRDTSTIVIASPIEGEMWRIELAGNFVPEAFGRKHDSAGLPTQLFLLEYFPADAPVFYRVRVLSTETGAVSLPVNLRNKSQLVDEQMAGLSRSQVVAADSGLLFTLYRGTIDGTPDGEPYAFVHTLDFGDGVWCLDLDPSLELDALPGTLAVAGDRLYVASANGVVGSYTISSITDPSREPGVEWANQIAHAGPLAPVMVANTDGLFVGYDDDQVMRIGVDGTIDGTIRLPGRAPTAISLDGSGELLAVGADWSTFAGVDVDVPDWLGDITQVVTG